MVKQKNPNLFYPTAIIIQQSFLEHSIEQSATTEDEIIC